MERWNDAMQRENEQQGGQGPMQPSSPVRPILAFMTDFGTGDGTVGVLKGVALGIVPDAQMLDISHEVAPQQVAEAAWILSTVYRYFPRGTVFVCVIDPGVGSTRHAIAVQAGDWFFVGPDNGLFSYVYAQQEVSEAVLLTNTAYHLPQLSSTFHGRDIFTPTAAHIARGVPLNALGPTIDPATLIRLPTSSVSEQSTGKGRELTATIVHVDFFGNLITGIPLQSVPTLFSSHSTRLSFPRQGITISERRRFFAETAEEHEQRPFMYGDSSGYVGVAVRNGNAAHSLGAGYGDVVTLVIE
jgi:S-adenosylmethionine hydrolase